MLALPSGCIEAKHDLRRSPVDVLYWLLLPGLPVARGVQL